MPKKWVNTIPIWARTHFGYFKPWMQSLLYCFITDNFQKSQINIKFHELIRPNLMLFPILMIFLIIKQKNCVNIDKIVNNQKIRLIGFQQFFLDISLTPKYKRKKVTSDQFDHLILIEGLPVSHALQWRKKWNMRVFSIYIFLNLLPRIVIFGENQKFSQDPKMQKKLVHRLLGNWEFFTLFPFFLSNSVP